MRYLTIVLMLLLASCSPAPFKGSDPGDQLRPYVDSFYKAWGGPHLEIQYNLIPLEGRVAQCVWNDRGKRIINVDPDAFWRFCKLEQKAMIWHELGHCILGRPHIDRPAVSYMTANIYGCQFIADNQAELDAEMFSP